MKIVKNNKGFTLIEIMTVIVFMAIMTGLIMANINSGKHAQLLKQAADEFVQDVRTIQGYATGGRETGICKGTYLGECLSDQQCIDDGWAAACASYPECDLPVTCGEVPKGGYGIEIQSQGGYVLYADTYICIENNIPITCTDTSDANGQERWYGSASAAYGDPANPVKTVSLIPPVRIYAIQYFDSGVGGEICTPGPHTILNNEQYAYVTYDPPFAGGHVIYTDNGGNTGYEQDVYTQQLIVWLEGNTSKCQQITINGISGHVDSEVVDCPAKDLAGTCGELP